MRAQSLGRHRITDRVRKINNSKPFAYLRATFYAIAARHPKNEIGNLLQWNFNHSS